jgi:predicted SprT family Zn-dependent metalloprotease
VVEGEARAIFHPVAEFDGFACGGVAGHVADDFQTSTSEWQSDECKDSKGYAKGKEHEDGICILSWCLAPGEAGDDHADDQQTHAGGADAAAEEVVESRAVVIEWVENRAEAGQRCRLRRWGDGFFRAQAFSFSLRYGQSASKERAWGKMFAVGLHWLGGTLVSRRMRGWNEQIRQRFGVKAVRPKRRKRSLPVMDGPLSEWCREASRIAGLEKLAEKVQVGWNSRLQTTAGRAWWPDGVIELNPKLREMGDEELWRTVRHELAHLVAYERAGRRRISAHGAEWQAACAELGIPGESATHSLPMGGRRVARKFAYVCGHCESTIERVRRMRGKAACYACCREHSGGQFDERFLLVERKL